MWNMSVHPLCDLCSTVFTLSGDPPTCESVISVNDWFGLRTDVHFLSLLVCASFRRSRHDSTDCAWPPWQSSLIIACVFPLVILCFCTGRFGSGDTGPNFVHRIKSARKYPENMERDRLGQWGNGDNVCPSKTSGLERMKNPNLNKVSYVMLLNAMMRQNA